MDGVGGSMQCDVESFAERTEESRTRTIKSTLDLEVEADSVAIISSHPDNNNVTANQFQTRK